MENYIEKAIKLAIENKWRFMGIKTFRVESLSSAFYRIYWEGDQYSKNEEEYTDVLEEQIFLDPNFWQALGKGLKLLDPECPNCHQNSNECECNGFGVLKESWHRLWIKFINHLAAKKDPNLFFKEIWKI